MMMVPRPVMGGNYNSNKPADFFSSSAEIKCVDVPTTSYLLDNSGTVTPLNLIASGSSYYQRIGRKIEMKSSRINGIINYKTTLGGQTNYYPFIARIMVIYDRQTNGALPSIQDILQTIDALGNPTTDNYSGVNLNNRDRFTILRDQRIYLPFIHTTTAPNAYPDSQLQLDPVTPTLNIDLYTKLKGLTTQYKADGSPPGIGDIATGALYLVTLGNYPTPAFQFQCQSRLRYLDRS